MRITISKIIEEDFTLSESQINEIALERLRQFIYPGEYLRREKDKIYLKQDDPDHRHGSISEVIVREATPLDLAVFEVIDELTEKRSFNRLKGI